MVAKRGKEKKDLLQCSTIEEAAMPKKLNPFRSTRDEKPVCYEDPPTNSDDDDAGAAEQNEQAAGKVKFVPERNEEIGAQARELGFRFAKCPAGLYRVTEIKWWAVELLANAQPSLAANQVRVGDCVTSIAGVRCEGQELSDLEALVQKKIEQKVNFRVGFDFGTGEEVLITVQGRIAPICKINLKNVSCVDPSVARARVVVIGAGVSGLAAARRLAKNHLHVTVVEARNRIGGRVHTTVLAGDDTAAPAYIDLGASFIHGCSAAVNPVYALALEHSAEVDQTQGGYSMAWAEAAAWFEQGKRIPTKTVQKAFNVMWTLMYNLRQRSQAEWAQEMQKQQCACVCGQDGQDERVCACAKQASRSRVEGMDMLSLQTVYQAELARIKANLWSSVRYRRYSVYLLYWYKITNTDA